MTENVINRINDLKPELLDACKRLGWKVKESRFLLVAEKEGKRCLIDGRDATGPIFERSLNLWLKDILPSNQVILIAMGFFAPNALKHILKDKGKREKIILVSFGLKDFFDTEFKPKKLQLASPTDLYLELETILRKFGLAVSPVECNYCGKKAIAVCNSCEAMLCKSHFVPCTFCRIPLCHPDVTGKMCFFQHECER